MARQGGQRALAEATPNLTALRPLGGGSGVELSDLDLQLIDLLQADGRMSFADLARRAGVTEKTVRRRLAHLRAEAFIEIVAVTDPGLLGHNAVALACIKLGPSANTRRLADTLAAIPEVDYVTTTTGRFALQAELMCADVGEVQRVVDDSIRPLSGVAEVELLSYLRLHYQQARFRGVVSENAGSAVRPRVLDDTDRVLISRLCVDGRASFAELSAGLGIAETTARQRLQRMAADGAVRVMAIANPLRIGYPAACWVAIQVDPHTRVVDVAEELTELRSVTYIAITAGSYDLVVEVVCPDTESLLDVVDGQIRTRSGVSRTEVWRYTDLHYKPLLPREFRR